MCAQRLQAYLDPTGLLFGSSTVRQQQQQQQQFDEQSDNYASESDVADAPLRFIIIRHGERVDVMYGGGWTQRAFNAAGQYYPFDSNMPAMLPHRVNWIDYDVDTPLTSKGLSQSWNVGNVLLRYNLPVTACYSSPAFRSIQTADRILEGMGRKGEHTVLTLFVRLFIFRIRSFRTSCTSIGIRSIRMYIVVRSCAYSFHVRRRTDSGRLPH
jgi:hypothetical protein